MSPVSPSEPSEPPQGGVASAPVSWVGWLLKIVVLPTAVACLFVAIWVVLGSWGLSPDDVDSCVEQLASGGNQRWRAAVNLAAMLQDPDNASIKSDRVLAGRLAGILEAEITAGSLHEEDIALRVYLCRALGEFHVADGLPVLLTAVPTERDSREIAVRRAAIEALAVLASNVPLDDSPTRATLVSVLLEASHDAESSVRSRAAFTLGVVGDREAETRLAAMLADGRADVRYNAATGLARHGDACSVDVLLEMLDPRQTAGVDAEKQQAARAFKRNLILINALRAVDQLATVHPEAIDPRLTAAVSRLTEPDTGTQIRAQATVLLTKLNSAGGSR